MSAKSGKEDMLLCERRGSALLLMFNRPERRNALNLEVLRQLNEQLDKAQNDAGVAAVVLTGGGDTFVAGADIAEMADMPTFAEAYQTDFTNLTWQRLASFRKPLIAAVAGYALGGGNEIAMMCDIVLAAPNAQFGQPEVKVGTMPGAGGTQRLIRAVGKAKAMEMCLTGRLIDAKEAVQAGLVSRIVNADQLLDEALAVAEKIGRLSMPLVSMIKESVNLAHNVGLADGLRFERRLFHSTFALEDRKEGMRAFVDKRKAVFKNK